MATATSSYAEEYNNMPLIFPVILDGTFFTVIAMNADNNKVSAKCEICTTEKIIKGALSSSGNFLLHLKRTHPESLNDYEQRKREVGPSIKKRKFEAKTRNLNATTISGSGVVGISITKTDNIKPKTNTGIEQLLFNFIVGGMHRPAIAEQPEFVKLLKGLNPQISVTARRSLEKRIHEESTRKMNDIKSLIKSGIYFCVTVDMWTSGGTDRNFIGTAAHWISSDLRRHSAILCCHRLEGAPTPEHTLASLASALESYDIAPEQVVSLVTDNWRHLSQGWPTELEARCQRDFRFVDLDQLLGESSFGEFSLPSLQPCSSSALSTICEDATAAVSLKPHVSALTKCKSIWNHQMTIQPGTDSIGRMIFKSVTTARNSTYDFVAALLDRREDCVQAYNSLGVSPLTPVEWQYLEEYEWCVRPVTAAVARLRNDPSCFYGELIPTLLTVEKKLGELIDSSTLKLCEPLARALMSGIRQRFVGLLRLDTAHSDAIVAAVSHPYFKLRWVPEHKTKQIWDLFLDETCKLFSRGDGNDTMSRLNVTPGLANDMVESRLKEEKDDDFFSFVSPTARQRSSSQMADNVRLECLQYLESGDTSIHMLHRFPSVKKVFVKYNSALTSAGPVERLFGFSRLMLDGRNLEDNLLEKYVFLNQ